MDNIYIQLICTAALSAVCAYLILPRLIRILKTSSSLDVPDHRSSHKHPTPTMGGISFFIGLIVAIIFQPTFEVIFSCTMISLAGILGLIDDSKGLSPKMKFLGQALIATGFFAFGFSISPLVEMTLDLSIPPFLDWALTVFFMLGVINAFNLIDGVDGLLIGLALISSLVLSVIFLVQGQYPFAFISSGIVGIALAFLLFNFEPAKIFMGDTGSLLIGTYISVSILKVTENESGQVSVIALSLVLLVCVDMFRLFLGRYLILKKPFYADRNHIHHILLKMDWSHKKIVLHVYGFQLFLVGASIYFSNHNSSISSLIILIVICISLYGVLQFLAYRKLQSKWKRTLQKKNDRMEGNQLLKSMLK